MSARAQALMGKTTDPTSFRVGWTTIILEGTNKKTFTIAIIAQPELHATLGPQFMAIAGENSTQTYTWGYYLYPVYINPEYSSTRIKVEIQSHIHILKNRRCVMLVGVPANLDLFGIYPPKSYLKDEDGMANLRSVV